MKQQLPKFIVVILLLFWAMQPTLAQNKENIIKNDSINAKVLNDFNEKNVEKDKK